MSNKLILNIQFSQQVKFKLAFDHSGGKTFGDLKDACVKRLDAFAKVAPDNLKQDLPVSFDPIQYSLQDQSSFILSDMDLVEDLCSNNDLIHLVFNQSIYIPKPQVQQQPSISNPNTNLTTSLSSQPIILNTSQSTTSIGQNPQQFNPPPQKPLTTQNQPLATQNQNKSGFMNEEDIQKLKQQFYLDTSLWDQSQSIGDQEIQLKFVQAQDPNKVYNFSCDLNSSLYEMSQQICQRLGNKYDGCNAIFFSEKGLPIVANLNQLHQRTVDECVKLLNKKILNVVLTRTSAGDKTFPKLNSDEGKDQIFIIHQGPKVLKVDIDVTTVLQLKQKIYHKLNIPTNVISLNYGGKMLSDNLILKDYNIQNNSNINLTFRMNQSVGYSDTYNYNFYMPWMVHLVKQSEQGIRQFRTHSLVYYSHESSLTYLHTLRQLSYNNAGLVLATSGLMKRQRLNQCSRIAFEEGFLRLYFDFIINSNQIPASFQLDQIFEYTRYWIYQIIELSKQYKINDIQAIETFKIIEQTCQVTLQKIITPAFLKLDKNDSISFWQIVNYETIKSRQQTEDKHTNGKLFSELELFVDPQLVEQFKIVQGLEKEENVWLSFDEFKSQLPKIQISNEWHQNEDKLKSSCLKIHSSVELKQHPCAPVLTKNALKQLVIYTSMNKDVAKPINIFDPMNGVEQPENPDTMAYQQSSISNKSGTAAVDSDDDSSVKLTTQITVEPEEAIIVLIDISGSMDEEYYKNDDLTRLGVVKAFFNAFADRTMAYNLKHVISLAYFDDRYLLKCDYTELFMQFKDLVNKAQPQGMTALYVALKNAIDSLLQFKKKYPNCILRIIALTDGEDNKGKYNPEFIAKTIVQNNIILDSFVVYDKCEGLKQITKAAGGQCFCPKTIQEGLRLFEFETILSAKIRKPQPQLTMQQVTDIFINKNKIEFDKEPRDIDLPMELKKQSINPKQLVRRISMDSQQLNQIAPHNYLKRVMKELMNYEQKPHPFVKVFPCTHDVSFWKIILIGPEQTPYAGGIYILYMRFPSDYPIKPPDLRFLTSIYHCNINKQGRICHSILGRNYTPDTRILQIFEAVYGLLMTPEPDDPLDTTIASEYMQDLQQYQLKAQQHNDQHAKRPMDEVLKEILGNDGIEVDLSDVELQEKIQEINNWINNSSKPQ